MAALNYLGNQVTATTGSSSSTTLAATLVSINIPGGYNPNNIVLIATIVCAGSSPGSSIGGIAQTNVNWVFLCWNSDYQNGQYMEVEVWLGYLTGTTGTTWRATNSGGAFQMTAFIGMFDGIPNQPNPLESYYTCSGSNPPTTNVILSSVAMNGADLALAAFVANGGMTGLTPIGNDGYAPFDTPNALASRGSGGGAYGDVYYGISSSAVPAANQWFEQMGGNGGYVGVFAVIKGGVGGSVYNLPFSESVAPAEGFSTSHRGSLPALTDALTLTDRLQKLPARLLPDSYSLLDTLGYQHGTLATKMFMEPFTLVEAFSKNSAFTGTDLLVQSDSFASSLLHGLTDSLGLNDAFVLADAALARALARGWSDPFSITDKVVEGKASAFADSIALKESFALGSHIPSQIGVVNSYYASGNASVSVNITTAPALGNWLLVLIGFCSGTGATQDAQTVSCPASSSFAAGFAFLQGIYYGYVSPTYGGGCTLYGGPVDTSETCTVSVTSWSGSTPVNCDILVLEVAGINSYSGTVDYTSIGRGVTSLGMITGVPDTYSAGDLVLALCYFTSPTATSFAGHPFANNPHDFFTSGYGGFSVSYSTEMSAGTLGLPSFSWSSSVNAGIAYFNFSALTCKTNTLSVSDNAAPIDLGLVKLTSKKPLESYALAETYLRGHAHSPAFSDSFALVEAFARLHSTSLPLADPFALLDVFADLHSHPAAFADLYSILEALSTSHAKLASLLDVLPQTDQTVFQLIHSPAFAELYALAEQFAASRMAAGTFAELLTFVDSLVAGRQTALLFSEAIGLAEAILTGANRASAFDDVLTLVDVYVFVYTPGRGAALVRVTGALVGSSNASGRVAAWMYAATTSQGSAAAQAHVSYLVAVLAKGASLLTGLAGFVLTAAGGATGASTASGIEGAGLLVAAAIAEGGSIAASDTCLATTGVGEADGLSPEMDCDTACVFRAEGNTMPDTPGSAVGTATYALLHLVAAARGASLAAARVHAPVAATWACGGGGTARYVSIVLCDAESVEGGSLAVGLAGARFYVTGACSPIMASGAVGAANYGPGRLAGSAAGRGRATAVVRCSFAARLADNHSEGPDRRSPARL